MYKYVVGIRNVDLDLKTRSKISEVENRFISQVENKLINDSRRKMMNATT